MGKKAQLYERFKRLISDISRKKKAPPPKKNMDTAKKGKS